MLHMHVPAGLGSDALKRAWSRQLRPLLKALWEHQDVQVGLHLSGAVLHGMARHLGEGLVALEQLVDAGRIELLAGGWSHPFLSGLPEQDAVSQLGLQSRLLEMRTGQRPLGCYLTEGVWDPDIPRVMDRAGLRYALVRGELLLAAGLKVSQVAGLHHTERGGKVLQVLATDPALDRLMVRPMGPEALGLLEQRRSMGVRSVLWVGSMNHLDTLPGGFSRWLELWLEALDQNGHWMRTALPREVAVRVDQGKGLLYLPSWVPANIAEAMTGVSEAELRSRGGHYLRAGRWEGLMVRYTESNRLHKRMLLASEQLQRLRKKIQRGQRVELDRLLDAAALALYRAQGSDVLWPAPGGGFYDQKLRMSAWRDLVEVEQLTHRAFGEHKKLRSLKTDLLCSGQDEILVFGPHVHAALQPSGGGALTEFTVPGVGNIVDVPTRREEAWHQELLAHARLPALVDDDGVVHLDDTGTAPLAEFELEDEDSVSSEVDDSAEMERLAGVLAVDRDRRAAFTDRFLGPGVTSENLRRGQYPEVGDFVGATYNMLHVEQDSERGVLEISLSREGKVQVGRESRLVQVRKHYSFHRGDGGVRVLHELVNRTSEPVETTFGLELPLALGPLATLDLPGAGHQRLDQLRTLEHMDQLTLHDPVTDARIHLHFSPACRVVLFPVVCVVRGERGGLKEAQQGVCLIPHWPVKLWGEEKVRMESRLVVER